LPEKADDVKAALLEKGFREGDRDHKFYFFHFKGKKTRVYTKISHGEREIHDENCRNMARQMRLSPLQFSEFVDCPLTLEKYVQILIQGNHLDDPSKQRQTPLRKLVVGKIGKREISAYCDSCKREFVGARKSGEKEADVVLRLELEFDGHQCSKLATHC